MSVFRWKERPISRSMTFAEPGEVLRYTAAGSDDEAFVMSFAMQATPQIISSPVGILYRQDIVLDPQAADIFYVDVPYGARQKQEGSYTLSFDTTGATVTVKQSRQTVNRYSDTGTPFIPDYKGAIGVTKDGVEGAEIVIPALKLTARYQHPLGIVSLPRIKQFARYTGTINSVPFLTFAAGEVLFLGAAGTEGTDTPTEVSYQFACSQNVTGLNIGDIASIAKHGWDYLWIAFKDGTSEGSPVKQPEFCYIERVYEEANLPAILGFGG